MCTPHGEAEGRQSTRKMASGSPSLGDTAQRKGHVRIKVNRIHGSKSDLSDTFYLLDGSFKTLD